MREQRHTGTQRQRSCLLHGAFHLSASVSVSSSHLHDALNCCSIKIRTSRSVFVRGHNSGHRAREARLPLAFEGYLRLTV